MLQSWAGRKLDPNFWHIAGPLQQMPNGDIPFDWERRFLYVAEPFADEDQLIIHVFAIRSSAHPRAAGTVSSLVQETYSEPRGPMPAETVRAVQAGSDLQQPEAAATTAMG